MLMTFDADGVVCLLSLAGLWDGLCLLSASGYSTVVFVTPLVWAVGETLSTFLFFSSKPSFSYVRCVSFYLWGLSVMNACEAHFHALKEGSS